MGDDRERGQDREVLLLKVNRTFQQVLAGAFFPLVILPASTPGGSRDHGKFRANDLAVSARIAGLGVTVVESKTGELFVMVSGNESQCVGFARKTLQELKTGEQWFLLLRDQNGPLLKEDSDRTREICTLTATGFTCPDQHVEIVAAYVPAQRNTAWGHSLGYDVGEHL